MDFGASRVSSRTGEMGRLVMAAEAICTLYKPVANMMMDGVEGSNRVIDDELCEAFDVQQTRSQNNQLLFCRRLAYKLAQWCG